jgi:hypothetical protein
MHGNLNRKFFLRKASNRHLCEIVHKFGKIFKDIHLSQQIRVNKNYNFRTVKTWNYLKFATQRFTSFVLYKFAIFMISRIFRGKTSKM